jgi:hypothetical protein
MAAITDLAAVANATAAGYALIQYVNSQGRRIARFEKNLKGENGTTGALSAVCGVGEDATSATTARTNALAALNANRRHRYAGAPGRASGSGSVDSWPDALATVPTTDSN